MIIKTLSRSNPSFKQLAKYILNQDKDLDDEQLVFNHNVRTQNIPEIVREYAVNESFRTSTRKNTVYLYHTIISFNNRDTAYLTPGIITDIANQYIALRGKDLLYVGAVHTDREHTHIHFMESGCRYRTGKSARMSKTDFKELKINLQEYHREKYPELSESFCDFGNGKRYPKEREYQLQKRSQKTLEKTNLKHKVLGLFEQSLNLNSFFELLQKNNFHVYERNGKPSGIIVDDKKYRFSILDINKEMLNSKVYDRNEDNKILEEIRQIRNANSLENLRSDNNRER